MAVIKADLFEKNSINVDLAFGFFAIFAESMPQPTTFSPKKSFDFNFQNNNLKKISSYRIFPLKFLEVILHILLLHRFS